MAPAAVRARAGTSERPAVTYKTVATTIASRYQDQLNCTTRFTPSKCGWCRTSLLTLIKSSFLSRLVSLMRSFPYLLSDSRLPVVRNILMINGAAKLGIVGAKRLLFYESGLVNIDLDGARMPVLSNAFDAHN